MKEFKVFHLNRNWEVLLDRYQEPAEAEGLDMQTFCRLLIDNSLRRLPNIEDDTDRRRIKLIIDAAKQLNENSIRLSVQQFRSDNEKDYDFSVSEIIPIKEIEDKIQNYEQRKKIHQRQIPEGPKWKHFWKAQRN